MADKKFLSSFLVLCFLNVNHSVAENLDEGFYSRSSEGWFFYNEEQETEDEEIEPEEQQVITEIPSPEPTVQELEPTQPKTKLVVGSAAWLKANLPIYLNNAIDNPTIENINAYLFLQKMSVDKANRFSNAYSLAVTGNPLFDDSLEQSETYAINRNSVNSIATLFNNENINDKIGERTIQHMFQSLHGESLGKSWDNALNNYIPFAGKKASEATKAGDKSIKTVETKDQSVREIVASTQSDVCEISSSNLYAVNGKRDCEVISENQAMGYEKTGEYGNLMRLSSESWIFSIRTGKLFKDTPLFPQNISDEAIRNFVYSLFGTGYTVFSEKSENNKTQKCIVNSETHFKSEQRTITAQILIEGGTYSSIVSNNPENKKGSAGKEFCWLIDTSFKRENTEWISPSKRILEKIGDFGSVEYKDENGKIDPSSKGYKKLSEETIIGNVYFSTSRDQGSLRDWTKEEMNIIGMFPENFSQALNNKIGTNSPQLIYEAAKECLKPTLTNAYKSLFKQLKEVVIDAINDYPAGKLNKDNKEKTIQHINQQYDALSKELDEYSGRQNSITCINNIFSTQNGSVNLASPVK
jgi:hypothetical protein